MPYPNIIVGKNIKHGKNMLMTNVDDFIDETFERYLTNNGSVVVYEIMFERFKSAEVRSNQRNNSSCI
jgi:hypothetical protein